MSPTPRAALALAVAALAALVLPLPAAAGLGAAIVLATLADAAAARRAPRLRRALPRILSRGVPAHLVVEAAGGGRVRLRQPAMPDVRVTPPEAWNRLDGTVVAGRRGRHELPAVAARREGPLRLGAWQFTGEGRTEVLVYPDVHAARRLVAALRRGRFREEGRRARGPLGLGTEFESIRDYVPDDDVRRVNWRASARLGRPMTNQYRVEQDRDVILVVDAGRLMAAPLGDRTRLDTAVDAATAVALAADTLGDRTGVVAFDAEVRRRLAPRRNGGDSVVGALYDLEPRPLDSDYDLAFRSVGGAKRALVLVLTDLLDEAAARSLVGAVPVLARRHAVVVASVTDPDLAAAVVTPPGSLRGAYAAAVALDLLDGRERVAATLRGHGATVVEAPPARLGEACVAAYVRLKERARL